MNIERALRGIAGFLIGLSVVLAVVHSWWWLCVTGFVSANLIQSAFTNWCPMMWILSKMGMAGCERSSAG